MTPQFLHTNIRGEVISDVSEEFLLPRFFSFLFFCLLILCLTNTHIPAGWRFDLLFQATFSRTNEPQAIPYSVLTEGALSGIL